MANSLIDPEMELLQVLPGPGNATLGNTDALEHMYKTTPMISGDAVDILGDRVVPQRALYGRILTQVAGGSGNSDAGEQMVLVPKLYVNTNAPFSGVICGLQGSGKSHSTAVILESCLIKDTRLGTLPSPLSAVVFHFDAAAGGGQGKPCEAAYLSALDPSRAGNASAPRVTVLVLPNNVNVMKRVYERLPNVEVRPLHFSQKDISGERLLSMMKVDDSEHIPLYMEVILTILRDMQEFCYDEFREKLKSTKLNSSQKSMLNLRLQLLDSCLKDGDEGNSVSSWFGNGCMTIIDLTSPFMDSSSACGFFDIILGLFLQSDIETGKVVVLDEAHKYLGDGGGSEKLTESLLTVIRQERHLNTRVVISTQEPTVVPSKFLELSSFIIAHRFSSPQWLRHICAHISVSKDSEEQLLSKVVNLQTGQSLVFAPSGLGKAVTGNQVATFGQGHLVVQSRQRITTDGGQSLLATIARVRTAETATGGSVQAEQAVSSNITRTTVTPTTLANGSAQTGASSSSPTPRPGSEDWNRFYPLIRILQNVSAEAPMTWLMASTVLWKEAASVFNGQFSPYVEAAELAGIVYCARPARGQNTVWLRESVIMDFRSQAGRTERVDNTARTAISSTASGSSTQVSQSSSPSKSTPRPGSADWMKFLPLITILQNASIETPMTWKYAAFMIKKEAPSAYTGKYTRYVEAAELAGMIHCDRSAAEPMIWLRESVAVDFRSQAGITEQVGNIAGTAVPKTVSGNPTATSSGFSSSTPSLVGTADWTRFSPLISVLGSVEDPMEWTTLAERIRKQAPSAHTGKFGKYVKAAELAGIVFIHHRSSLPKIVWLRKSVRDEFRRMQQH